VAVDRFFGNSPPCHVEERAMDDIAVSNALVRDDLAAFGRRLAA
jgi:hypothetical protein